MKLSDVRILRETRTFQITITAPKKFDNKVENHWFDVRTYKLVNEKRLGLTAESDHYGHIGDYSKVIISKSSKNMLSNQFCLYELPGSIRFQKDVYHKANYCQDDTYTLDVELIAEGSFQTQIENILELKPSEFYEDYICSWNMKIKLLESSSNLSKVGGENLKNINTSSLSSYYEKIIPSHYIFGLGEI